MNLNSSTRYTIHILDGSAHLFGVQIQIEKPSPTQQIQFASWIPGSYLIREFCRHVQTLRAHQNDIEITPIQPSKDTWQFDCNPVIPLVLSYEVYAFDNSVRAAWLSHDRAFFNATALCARIAGQDNAPMTLEIAAPNKKEYINWRVATSLKAATAGSLDENGFGIYLAQNYDELIDSPVEMGDFLALNWVSSDTPHRLVLSGVSPSFDAEKLIADAQKICATAIAFWHPNQTGAAPFSDYTFLLNCTEDGFGGLEHRASTALIGSRKSLPRHGQRVRSEDYLSLLRLISHEYFHSWNVKRLRPLDFYPYRLNEENHTELLWFFEGFTNYYDDLLVLRSGAMDRAAYLKIIEKNINYARQTPGQYVQSVAQASFDAWVKYYRPDENTPNSTISYYTKGSLVALCLDLTLRSEGLTTLDDVMRDLWQTLYEKRTGSQKGALEEADILASLQKLSQRNFESDIKKWVHTPCDLPLEPLLLSFGVGMIDDQAAWAQLLGIRVDESASSQGGSIVLKTVLRHSIAANAGLSSRDEWLGISLTDPNNKKTSSWRLRKLDDLKLFLGELPPPNGPTTFDALICREQQLLTLPMSLTPQGSDAINRPDSTQLCRLIALDESKIKAWLG